MRFIAAPAQAVMEKVLPRRHCMDASKYLVVREEIQREELISHLVSIGYYRADLVEEVGDLSVRGDIKALVAELKTQGLSSSRLRTITGVISGIYNSAIEDEIVWRLILARRWAGTPETQAWRT